MRNAQALAGLRGVPELVCAVAGSLTVLGFAPYGAGWLVPVTLALAFALTLRLPDSRAGMWRAARLGWCFGLGWFGWGVSWIYLSLHNHGGLPALLSAAATGLLAALLALFPAVALGLAIRWVPPHLPYRLAGVAGAWMLSEFARCIVFTGFPWLALGYAHTDTALAGYAAVLGVYGVEAASTVIALALAVLAIRLAAALRGPDGLVTLLPTLARTLLITTGILLFGWWLGRKDWSEPAGAPVRVRLVQGNIAQDVKFGDSGLDLAEQAYLPSLATPEPALAPALIVWPESAFPEPVNDLPDRDLEQLFDDRLRRGADLLFGAFIVESGHRYFNSAIGITRDAEPVQRYSKRHLVPFGEFVPWGMHWFIHLLDIPMGDQESGAAIQAPLTLGGQVVAVNICFEDVFGGEIRQAWAAPGKAPTMLVNLSNLAWFDDSIGLPQHLQMSRMRAMETARPLLRATNTGVTAAIDSTGRVLGQLPVNRAGVLEIAVTPMSGTTPFVRWGNAPMAWLAAIASLMAVILGHRKTAFRKTLGQ